MKGFQDRIAVWCNMVFGSKVANNKSIRNHRFIEEALELVQSLGMSRKEVLNQVDYVYGRQTGLPYQEIGGVMVTLAQLATVNDLNIDDCRVKEFTRIVNSEVMENIRVKEKNKQTLHMFNEEVAKIDSQFVVSYDPIRDFNKNDVKVSRITKKAIKADVPSDSSTGKSAQSNLVLYVWVNKIDQPYAGGLAVVIASTQTGAQFILSSNIEDYIVNRYDYNNWKPIVITEGIKTPIFIAEHSYIE